MYLIIIGIVLLLAALIVRRSKILYCLQILYLWMVAANNSWNPDYENYINGYQHIYDYQGRISEPIYWLLARVSNYMGLDFHEYRYLFFGIAFLILAISIWKLSFYPNLVIGLYFLYPYSVDVIQMRSLMAVGIVLLAVWKVQQYQELGRKRDLLFGGILIMLAAGFHYSAIAAVVIILALLSRKNFISFFPMVVFGMIAILLLGISLRTKIVEVLTNAGIFEKLIDYKWAGVTRSFYTLSVFLLRVIFIELCWIAVHSPLSVEGEAKAYYYTRVSFLFRCVCLLSFYALAEAFVSMEFERLSRIAVLIGYSLLTNVLSVSEEENYKYIGIALIMFVVGYLYIMYFRHFSTSSNWFEYAFLPIFEHNYIG